jgi:hypothetical protein
MFVLEPDTAGGASFGVKTLSSIEGLIIGAQSEQSSTGTELSTNVVIDIVQTQATGFDLSFGVNGLALIGSTSSNDLIQGTEKPELIIGIEGRDTLTGGGGNDTLDGGDGDDRLDGGAGDDRVFGGRGNDYIIGSLGDDALTGYFGYDTVSYRELDLSSGLSVNFGQGAVTYAGTAGQPAFTDTLVSIETFFATKHDDTIDASQYGYIPMGNVRGGFGLYNGINPGQGDDTIIGNGSTRLRFNDGDPTSGITVDLSEGTASSDYHGTKTILGGVNSIQGTRLDDVIKGGDAAGDWFESYLASLGNDRYDGGTGYDRVEYHRFDTTETGLSINLAQGTVTGKIDGSQDTLVNIDAVIGSHRDDVYDARGMADNGTTTDGQPLASNQFEGAGGNDTIYGNGQTTIRFSNAQAGVYVNLAEGESRSLGDGDAARVGEDTFEGVYRVYGSNHGDVLTGGSAGRDGFESFRGMGGNDTIDGGDGWDMATYGAGDTYTVRDGQLRYLVDDQGNRVDIDGVTIRLADGVVEGGTTHGTDTLRSVEAVRGSVGDDLFDARGFSDQSTNAGSRGLRNEFEGSHGNDTIIGNGQTYLSYRDAFAGVTVDFTQGKAASSQSLVDGTDEALIGTDTFEGVKGVNGSRYNDRLIGDAGADDTDDTFECIDADQRTVSAINQILTARCLPVVKVNCDCIVSITIANERIAVTNNIVITRSTLKLIAGAH